MIAFATRSVRLVEDPTRRFGTVYKLLYPGAVLGKGFRRAAGCGNPTTGGPRLCSMSRIKR
jgi:hypothetical protein